MLGPKPADKMGKLSAGLVQMELLLASLSAPSGPSYNMTFGSGLLYPSLPSLKGTLVFPCPPQIIQDQLP